MACPLPRRARRDGRFADEREICLRAHIAMAGSVAADRRSYSAR